MAAAAFMLAAGAQANLSDGYEAAIQRWGKPTSQSTVGTGSVVSYQSNGWLIQQFYDVNGIAQAVRYYKPTNNGQPDFITQAERDAL
jgi:hypothetical protein